MDKLNVKAIFFDFDDTLQSRKGAYRLYCESFLTKYFPDISEAERLQKLDEMEEYVDGGYKDREVYFPEMIDLWKWENHPPLQELYDSFNFDFGRHIVMLDGAVDVLKEIKKRGYILGCITNGVSSLQNIKLDTAGIRDADNAIEKIGVDKAKKRLSTAELVIAVFDASSELCDDDIAIIEEIKGSTCIAVINKEDLNIDK